MEPHFFTYFKKAYVVTKSESFTANRNKSSVLKLKSKWQNYKSGRKGDGTIIIIIIFVCIFQIKII